MGELGTAQAEMPKYRCHKEVHALKIGRIEKVDGPGARIIPVDPNYSPFLVRGGYMGKHCPQVGGYYVVKKDGQKSFSPAEAFEAGYSLIE